ncbi:MAG: hypothetical protein HUU50_09710 [Candidatus Brocadiae bacterium]|nr:hypothetical protein [Candidatus Brocadiia bacterium]
MKTWTDPLVRVYEHEEEIAKSKLLEIRNSIQSIEKEIKKIQEIAKQEEEKTLEKIAQNVSPNFLASSFWYGSVLYSKEKSLEKNIQEYKTKEQSCLEEIRKIAEKRILLEGIQKKIIHKAKQEALHKEEIFLDEVSALQWMENKKP